MKALVNSSQANYCPHSERESAPATAPSAQAWKRRPRQPEGLTQYPAVLKPKKEPQKPKKNLPACLLALLLLCLAMAPSRSFASPARRYAMVERGNVPVTPAAKVRAALAGSPCGRPRRAALQPAAQLSACRERGLCAGRRSWRAGVARPPRPRRGTCTAQWRVFSAVHPS